MATIQLHSDCPNDTTNVSNRFIDTYMPEANGEFVKVYLYLLRCLGNQTPAPSISAIADLFEHTEKDVVRALKYWEKVSLIRIEYAQDKTISGICILDISSTVSAVSDSNQVTQAVAPASHAEVSMHTQSPTAPPSKQTAPELVQPIAPAKKEYTLDEIKAFQKDEDISELFFIIETYLKHPLSTTDTNTILYWHESLHFSTELIVYLVEYCLSKGHSSLRYMDKVALGWNDSNITTVDQAKDNVATHSQAYYAVMKALGISGRNLVDNEISFITKWTKDYAFDLEIIQEACKRTITATHQPSFEYTDSILTSWNKNHVHTVKDIEQLDSTYSRSKKITANIASPSSKNKFNNFNQREYDSDQLEKMLLTTSVH